MAPSDQAVELLRTATESAQRNEFEQARIALSELLQLEPRHPIAAGMLAAVYAELNLTESAIQYFQNAIQLNPENVLARFQLGLLLLNVGRPKSALDAWSLGDYGVHGYLVDFHRGVAFTRLNCAKDALASFRQSQALMPVDHALYPQLLTHLMQLSN